VWIFGTEHEVPLRIRPRYVPDVRDNPGKIGLRFTERPRPGPMDRWTDRIFEKLRKLRISPNENAGFRQQKTLIYQTLGDFR